MMANLGGLISGMQAPDEFPDTKKANPRLFEQLGIPNPNEQADQAAKQAQIMQLLQQQIEQQRQQNAIQKASVRPTAFPMLSAMGLNIPNAQQKAPAASPQQGPQGFDPSSLVAQEFQRSPNDPVGAKKRAGVKLLQMAIQRGDPNLQDIATNILQRASDEERAANKENIDNQAKQSEMGSRALGDQIKVNQLGNNGTPFQVHEGQNLSEMVPTYDKTGRQTGYQRLATGQNVQHVKTEDVTGQFKAFQDQVRGADRAMTGMSTIVGRLKQGAAQGWPAIGVGIADDVKGTLQQLVPGSKLADKELSSFGPTFDEWAKKTRTNSAMWKELAYSVAKANNPGSPITKADVVDAMGQIGGNVSDPAAVAAILEQTGQRITADVDRSYNTLGKAAQADGNNKAVYDYFKKKYPSQKKKTKTQKNSKTNKYRDVYEDGSFSEERDGE